MQECRGGRSRGAQCAVRFRRGVACRRVPEVIMIVVITTVMTICMFVALNYMPIVASSSAAIGIA